MARAALNLTTVELARVCGLDKQTISRMQSGTGPLSNQGIRSVTEDQVVARLRERGIQLLVTDDGKAGVLAPAD